MISVYLSDGSHMTRRPIDIANEAVPEEAVWVDLAEPSEDEIRKVEALVRATIPSRAEMMEIEISSRLYSDANAEVMNIPVIHGLHSDQPSFAPVTFMLASKRLVTIRYSDPTSFKIFAARLCHDPSIMGLKRDEKPLPGTSSAMSEAGEDHKAESLLVGILETVVDRVADLLETISTDLDQIATDIFSSSSRKKPIGTVEFKRLLRRIGEAGDLASRVREALAIFDRLTPFLQLVLDGREKNAQSLRRRLKIMSRDVRSLNDFCSFLSNKTTFLLDTTVGMISIEQNGIIKVFSVASVAFLPPTLIASIYGMNFRIMPELDWSFGYPMAIVLMVMSGLLPTIYFRSKGWF
ncbi:probable magnesium and cobalt transport transmembrane protein [Fulvimarina pelagi HTCC2506]|uniref:Magnesium transport protein CorA n=1 Tax=Fulvimarina pelagi HTCC2506 TaxID=314231 RepID=Q0G4S3_9HYPH|nr:magnesium transporter CorA family protein [Fulvimarina pelagi]EAU43341.1 probable magnesium and cobalt transport transmembrane protein [Fulvimarina pelagi HTCC2506]